MAWTDLNFTVGQILTAAQMNNLQGNFSAVMNGDSGAPNLKRAALEPAVTGSNIIMQANTERTNAYTSYTKIKEIRITVNGTYSIYFELRSNAGGFVVYAKIYVNGVAVGTERSSTSTSYAGFSEDISISAGDLVQLYYYSPSAQPVIRNFRVRENAPIFPIVLLD